MDTRDADHADLLGYADDGSERVIVGDADRVVLEERVRLAEGSTYPRYLSRSPSDVVICGSITYSILKSK